MQSFSSYLRDNKRSFKKWLKGESTSGPVCHFKPWDYFEHNAKAKPGDYLVIDTIFGDRFILPPWREGTKAGLAKITETSNIPWLRTCDVCGATRGSKELTNDFSPHKKSRAGFKTMCKSCWAFEQEMIREAATDNVRDKDTPLSDEDREWFIALYKRIDAAVTGEANAEAGRRRSWKIEIDPNILKTYAWIRIIKHGIGDTDDNYIKLAHTAINTEARRSIRWDKRQWELSQTADRYRDYIDFEKE